MQEKNDKYGKRQFSTQKSFPYRIMGFALIAATQKIDLGLIIISFMKIRTQEISRKALKNKEKTGKK